MGGGPTTPLTEEQSTEKDYHPEITPFPDPRSARPASPLEGEEAPGSVGQQPLRGKKRTFR